MAPTGVNGRQAARHSFCCGKIIIYSQFMCPASDVQVALKKPTLYIAGYLFY